MTWCILHRHHCIQYIRSALLIRFHLDTHFRLEEFVTTCPENLTGADFYALCSDAMLHSIKRQIHSLEAGAYGVGRGASLSPPRVINVKFPLQPHQKYYIKQDGELGF